jgi:polyisoprenoid-binding protein YceI
MATSQWALDPAHSEITFKVKHLMITNVTGTFGSFEASAETEEEDFSTAKITFSADVTSINTNSEQRDGHLKSGDFFDTEKYPRLSFSATAMDKVDEDTFKMTGDLTIKDVTNSVVLNVEFGGITKDPWGQTKAGFTISGKINRKDFGLDWNAVLETGGVLVSEEVRLNCEIQLTKK